MKQGPLVLIGVGGMLWRAWDALLGHCPRVSPTSSELDLTRPATFEAFITPGTPLVINCAAYTNVDACETNEALATAVNGTGVGDLARHCARVGATLIHYSTDYVFDGKATSPYRVDAPRSPVSAYGRGKALGEELIEQSGCDHLILRTSWLYAPWGNNFVRTIAKLATQRDALKVVDDQRGRPTSAEHLARTTLTLHERGRRGIHHVTDGGECTWYEFARHIVALRGSPCTVNPCTTDEFPRPARRPAYSVLDLTDTEAHTGPMPRWELQLTNVIQRLEPL